MAVRSRDARLRRKRGLPGLTGLIEVAVLDASDSTGLGRPSRASRAAWLRMLLVRDVGLLFLSG